PRTASSPLAACDARPPSLSTNSARLSRRFVSSSTIRTCAASSFILLKCEREKDRPDDERVGDKVIPPERLTEEKIRYYGKDHQSNALLHDLQLRDAERLRAYAVGRNLKDVFKERHRPANQDHPDHRLLFVLQMTIPRYSHKDVRDDEQDDRLHCAPSDSSPDCLSNCS